MTDTVHVCRRRLSTQKRCFNTRASVVLRQHAERRFLPNLRRYLPASRVTILGRAMRVLNQYIRPLAGFWDVGGEIVTIQAADSPVSRRGRGARLARDAQLPFAAALTLLLAFRAGGFFPAFTAVAAVGGSLALVFRVTLAEEPFGGWSRAGAVASLAMAAFASLVLLSGIWSHAPARAVVEFDRALLYLEVLILYAL